MKLQNMAVLFVIIIIPIVLVMSAYIQGQVDTIALQTQYDNLLRNATYDSIKAMQLNTLDDQFSNVADSKRRDIKAAINVYMNSLSTGLGVSGYSDEYIKPFTPALVYTLYDGYYIYSPTKNATGNLEYILKPYSYYSEKVGDYIICYTLDNYVTIYGDFGNGYEQKSGYLLNNYSGNGGIIKYSYNGKTAYKYNGVTIEENCESSLYELNTSGNKGYYNNDTNSKNYAYKFCEEAFDFSTIIWNNATLKKHFNLGGSNAYLTSPENPQSQFNEHRREVIKASIESNIKQAFAEYNSISGMAHEFRIPVITEEEWDLVLRNVSMISFFQGLPVGTKYYNNYAIVTNTLNKEFVDPNGLRFTNTEQNTEDIKEETYHKINCEGLNDTGFIIGYRNVDLEKWPYTHKSESATGEITSETRYYYKHKNVLGYECLVDSNESNNINDVDEPEKKNVFWITLARERYKQHYVGAKTSSATNAGNYKAPQISANIINMETGAVEGVYSSGQYVKDKYVRLEFSNPMGYNNPQYQISSDGGTTWGDVLGNDYMIIWATVTKESQTGKFYKVRYNQGDLSISNESDEFEVKIKLSAYYTVEYDGNGNDSGITNETLHAIGETSKLAENGFRKNGYKFTGWNTNKNGTGTNYNAGQEVIDLTQNKGAIIQLYAQWSPITYKIIYHANGANSGTTDESTHIYDVSKALTANGFNKIGYEFVGWTTESDGTGNKYIDRQSVKNLTTEDGAIINLYAKWQIVIYTISYNLNDGIDPGNPSTYTVEDTVTLKNPTKTGYEFLGWTGSNLTTPSTSVTIPKGSTGNKEYTANWKPKTIVVTFMRNVSDTDTTSATQTFAYGVPNQKFSAKNWTNTGYKLTGWINKENNRKYTVESSVQDTWIDEFSPKVTLHAIWEKTSVVVTLNANGGVVSGPNTATYTSTVTVGGIYGFTGMPATRTGYTFDGWYTAVTGGTKVTSTTTVTKTTDHTLYAHWTKVSVTSVAIDQTDKYLQYKTGNYSSTTTLTATVSPSNATLTWTSSNTAVATVSSTGKVTAKAPGTAKITVTAGGKTDSINVYVYLRVKFINNAWNTYSSTACNTNSEGIYVDNGNRLRLLPTSSKKNGYTVYKIYDASKTALENRYIYNVNTSDFEYGYGAETW